MRFCFYIFTYFQGTPSVTETFIDSKKEVDNQLKKTCEEFIALVTTMLVGPLRDFIEKVWDQCKESIRKGNKF